MKRADKEEVVVSVIAGYFNFEVTSPVGSQDNYTSNNRRDVNKQAILIAFIHDELKEEGQNSLKLAESSMERTSQT